MHGQKWAGGCAVAFLYSFVPYRAEWRYSTSAHRVALIDAGHVVQNLYLACEAIECGTCAVAAIDQTVADALCCDARRNLLFTQLRSPFRSGKKSAGNRKMYEQTILESNVVKPLDK